ncbi:MAG TPA: branched-chain amino acid ABC transporter permease, partial [Burkholderiales bacterium]
MSQQVKSLALVALAVAACAIVMLLFLQVEAQWKVVAFASGVVVALLIMERTGLRMRVEAASARHGTFALSLSVVATMAAAVVLHESHFALLMLATVALYATACLGLTIQFGYAGIANFAGAAFFGIGCYSAAILSAHTSVPHLLVILAGGAIAALISSVLILPILRTRGHYAALITIAFGILFKTFLEVNDTLGGPQGLKVPGMHILGWSFNDPIRLGTQIEAS